MIALIMCVMTHFAPAAVAAEKQFGLFNVDSEHPEAIHGFVSLPGVVPVAAKALDEIVDFVREVV